MKKRKLLNLGCGSYYHSDWVNCDIACHDKNILKVDVKQALPFPNGKYDMVYSSHLLEHLNKSEAHFFLKECRRVLKKGGIVRIAAPDMEEIARQYLYYLSKLKKGNIKYEKRYFWMLLELFDQMVREKPGGEMLETLRDDGKMDKEFILKRIGYEAENYWKKKTEDNQLLSKLKRVKSLMNINNAHNLLIIAMCYLLGGKRAAGNYFLGFFRNAGEIHKYMYDEYSLKKLLLGEGFSDIRKFSAVGSYLKEFGKYNLDAIGGEIRKPDSLFMEAVK